MIFIYFLIILFFPFPSYASCMNLPLDPSSSPPDSYVYDGGNAIKGYGCSEAKLLCDAATGKPKYNKVDSDGNPLPDKATCQISATGAGVSLVFFGTGYEYFPCTRECNDYLVDNGTSCICPPDSISWSKAQYKIRFKSGSQYMGCGISDCESECFDKAGNLADNDGYTKGKLGSSYFQNACELTGCTQIQPVDCGDSPDYFFQGCSFTGQDALSLGVELSPATSPDPKNCDGPLGFNLTTNLSGSTAYRRCACDVYDVMEEIVKRCGWDWASETLENIVTGKIMNATAGYGIRLKAGSTIARATTIILPYTKLAAPVIAAVKVWAEGCMNEPPSACPPGFVVLSGQCMAPPNDSPVYPGGVYQPGTMKPGSDDDGCPEGFYRPYPGAPGCLPERLLDITEPEHTNERQPPQYPEQNCPSGTYYSQGWCWCDDTGVLYDGNNCQRQPGDKSPPRRPSSDPENPDTQTTNDPEKEIKDKPDDDDDCPDCDCESTECQCAAEIAAAGNNVKQAVENAADKLDDTLRELLKTGEVSVGSGGDCSHRPSCTATGPNTQYGGVLCAQLKKQWDIYCILKNDVLTAMDNLETSVDNAAERVDETLRELLETGDVSVSGAGSCEGEFSCTVEGKNTQYGEALCAQLREQRGIHCLLKKLLGEDEHEAPPEKTDAIINIGLEDAFDMSGFIDARECPAPTEVELPGLFVTSSATFSIKYDKVCEFFGMVSNFVIAFSLLFGLMIVMGGQREI